MLKEKALKKILITSIFVVIILILYIFPNYNNSNTNESFKSSVVYKNTNIGYIYVLDSNDFLVRVDTLLVDSSKIEDRVSNIIDKLINNDTLPSNFVTIIPKSTKINEIKFNDGELIIDFSNNLLDVSKDKYDCLIESICYSIFEVNSIKSISIYLDGESITKYINIPKKITREFGINKIVDISGLKNIEKVITYYVEKEDNNSYYVPITTYSNSSKDKIKVIIENLSSNYIYGSNLISLLNSKAELINYEINDDLMNLYFNNNIFISDGTILEEVVYSISYSIFDNYDVDRIVFYVDNKDVTHFEKK